MPSVVRRTFGAMIGCADALGFAGVVSAPAVRRRRSRGTNLSSNTEAGSHPDLTATFTLAEPGQPEAAESVAVNLPAGCLRQSKRDHSLHPCRFRADAVLNRLPGRVHHDPRNQNGDPNLLLGTAPIYVVSPRADKEPARLAFYVPMMNVAINIPIHLRTAADYGVRMTVDGIPSRCPWPPRLIRVWGLPAQRRSTTTSGLYLDLPGSSGGLPGAGNCAMRIQKRADSTPGRQGQIKP